VLLVPVGQEGRPEQGGPDLGDVRLAVGERTVEEQLREQDAGGRVVH
jgi:hypothetical protein